MRGIAGCDRVEFFTHTLVQCRERPVHVWRGVVAGWTVLLAIFWLLGDYCDVVAFWIFGWTRAYGYSTGDFGPFYGPAAILTCSGFVLSGYATTRWHRDGGFATIAAFSLSVLIAVAFSVAAVISKPTPVNHTWFFVIWTALPFWSYVGFVLNPLLVAVGGLLALRAR
jgi:hypothetical protein